MKQASINLRALAAVSLCASTEETRYYLNGVMLEIEATHITYVATDGHRLFALRETRAEGDNDLIGQVIIPIESCKAIKLRKNEDGAAVLEGESLSGQLFINADSVVHGFKPIDGVFPDWRRVIPQPGVRSGLEIARFNWAYVASFQKIGELLDLGQPQMVFGADSASPARVLFPGGPDMAFGVIMPIRTNDDLVDLPDFAYARKPVAEEPVMACAAE